MRNIIIGLALVVVAGVAFAAPETTDIVYNASTGEVATLNAGSQGSDGLKQVISSKKAVVIGAEIATPVYKSFSRVRSGASSSYVGSYYTSLEESNLLRLKLGTSTRINKRNIITGSLVYQGTFLEDAYGVLTDSELANLDSLWPYYSLDGYLNGVGVDVEYGFLLVPAISINPFVSGYVSTGSVCAKDDYDDKYLAATDKTPQKFSECYYVKGSSFDLGTRVVAHTPYGIEPYIGFSYSQANLRNTPYEAMSISVGIQTRLKNSFTNLYLAE